MAVMNKMRDMTKTILYLLVLAFIGTIIFDWGMSYSGRSRSSTAIGEVDGVEIDAREFDTTFRRQLEMYKQQTGGTVPDNQLSFIRNQVWELMVRNLLIQRELSKRNITVSDAEISYRLFDNPPEFLRSYPNFLDENKQFDMRKYSALINDPGLRAQWLPVEEQLRQALPFEKFRMLLTATVRTTEDEIMREYLKQNQKVAVEYIFIDPRKFSKDVFEFTDEMVAAYYNTHKDDYKQEEQRAFQYVLFPTTPTAEDSAEIRAQVQNYLQRAKQGEDFAELAATYSEDEGSKEKGGDLGYFGKGAMVKPFEEAAFSAKIGDIVGPVESQFGLHIIKVEDKRLSEKRDDKGRREEEVKASHILVKYSASDRTRYRIQDDAEYLAQKAKDGSLAKFAKELADSAQTTGLFVKGQGFVPGFGVNKTISNFVFRSKVGDVGSVEETNRGLLVYQVTEIKPEQIKPLDDVKSLIRNKLTSDAQMSKAGELAAEIHTRINGGMDFATAAQHDSLEVKTTGQFSRSGFVEGIGRDTKFIGCAFGLAEIGDISKPIEGTRGYYLLKLHEKAPFAKEQYDSQRDQLMANIGQRKTQQVLAEWFADAKSKADIKDYRDRFYN